VTVLRALGIGLQRLTPGVVVLTRRGPRLELASLDDRCWVVQRPDGPRRQVRRVGPPELRTHLVVDETAARAASANQQMKLAHYLAAEHLGWVLRELEVNCVLDVGGNRGQFGRRLRHCGYAGRIVSFEPLPHLADQLRTTAAGDPDWHVVQCALAQEETEADMTVVGDGGATSSLLPPTEFAKQWSPRISGIRTETVPVRRLDGLLDAVTEGLEEPRTFLKMDTQGYDLRVFDGVGGRVKEIVGLQSEVSNVPLYEDSPRMHEAISAYEASGFETTGVFPVTRDTARMRVIEFDIVMVRTDALVT